MNIQYIVKIAGHDASGHGPLLVLQVHPAHVDRLLLGRDHDLGLYELVLRVGLGRQPAAAEPKVIPGGSILSYFAVVAVVAVVVVAIPPVETDPAGALRGRVDVQRRIGAFGTAVLSQGNGCATPYN
jgi:hypothetical protein